MLAAVARAEATCAVLMLVAVVCVLQMLVMQPTVYLMGVEQMHAQQQYA